MAKFIELPAGCLVEDMSFHLFCQCSDTEMIISIDGALT